MDQLIKVVRAIANFPILGNLVLIVLVFLPFFLALLLKVSIGVALLFGGLGMAALCYFLKSKNVLNILAPGGIPMWIIGIAMALGGVYSIIKNILM